MNINNGVRGTSGRGVDVYLPFTTVDDSAQEGLEPQVVKIRNNNYGTFFIVFNSRSQTNLNNPYQVGTRNQAIVRRATKLAARHFYGIINIPNINPTNNIYYIFFSGTQYTFTIPTGFYAVTDFNTALLAALNGLSGVVWTSTSLGGNYWRLTNTTSVPFQFIGGNGTYTPLGANPPLPGSVPGYGEYNSGIYTTPGLVNNIVYNPNLYYTRYFDICSKAISQWSKTGSLGDTSSQDLLLRVYSNRPTGDQANFAVYEPLTWTHYVRSEVLSTVDVSLYDEFGNNLYVNDPVYPINFGFVLEMVAEV